MGCIQPNRIKNPKFTVNKKNSGHVPVPLDPRVLWVNIPCGYCEGCMKKKGNEWMTRMIEDIKTHKNGKFVTLSFSNESYTELYNELKKEYKNYDLDNAIARLAVRRFTERWRDKYKKTIRHWLVTEIGGKNYECIHLHGIVWTNQPFTEIAKIWKYGNIYPTKDNYKKNYVNAGTVSYITKYVTKQDKKHKYYRPRIFASKGLGANYINTSNAKSNTFNPKGETREHYTTPKGNKIALPTYWKGKIYTDEEREKLFIQKLDKQVTWINGEKIDLSKPDSDIELYKAKQYAQQKSIEHGYQSETANKQHKIEEHERRRRKQKERVNNAKPTQKPVKRPSL